MKEKLIYTELSVSED